MGVLKGGFKLRHAQANERLKLPKMSARHKRRAQKALERYRNRRK